MDDFNYLLPERLRELRQSRHLSMKLLSENIGVSDIAISNWENSINEPTARNIMQLSIFFGVSTDYLLGLKDY